MTINFRRQIQRSADWISAPWYARDHICLALKLPEPFIAPDASISSSPYAKRGNGCRLAVREGDELTSSDIQADITLRKQSFLTSLRRANVADA
jgi:hypothetical protein